MTRKITLITLIVSINFCFSQFLSPLSPSKVILKTGDSITGIIGKLSGKKFKYKISKNDKAKKIPFSEINSVEINYPNSSKTFHFFKTTWNNSYKPYQAYTTDGKVELYFQEKNYSNQMAGGMTVNGTFQVYYIRRKNEEKLLKLGPYSPLTNNLREKVMNYFSDCDNLVKKIKNREFKVRNGLNNIIEYYNKNCK